VLRTSLCNCFTETTSSFAASHHLVLYRLAHGFHHCARHRNSAGAPPALAEKIQHGSNCLRNAGGTPLAAAASTCATDFFRDVFIERKTLAVRTVRCVVLRNRNDGGWRCGTLCPNSNVTRLPVPAFLDVSLQSFFFHLLI